MKLSSFYQSVVWLSLISFLPAFGAQNATNTPMVQDEYAKEKERFDTAILAARKKLRDLQKSLQVAMDISRGEAKVDLEGVAAMKKYWTLINYRYGNEEGKFQKWKVMDPKDVENINNLFGIYLRSKPLVGRVSAGTADRTLDWGMTRLEELAKMHNSPKPDNNSEVEILSYQVKDIETKMKIIAEQADRLGVKLTEKQPGEEDGAPQRSVASEE